MLVALAGDGRRQVATPGARTQQFSCPDCGGRLIVRVPTRRVPHFAHAPGAGCKGRLTRAERAVLVRARAAARRAERAAAQAEAAGQDALFDLDQSASAEPGQVGEDCR